MAKIAYLKTHKTKGYITLGVNDGESTSAYTVTEIVYSEIGSPVRGDAIDRDTLERLIAEDELYRATRRALSILSYADNSERMLKMKLARLGFSHKAIEYAACVCVEHGYIDEERQLEIKIEALANGKLRGKYYIREYLIGKGYSQDKINGALSRLLECGEIDFRANFEALAEKSGASTDGERYALMKKYGYKR